MMFEDIVWAASKHYYSFVFVFAFQPSIARIIEHTQPQFCTFDFSLRVYVHTFICTLTAEPLHQTERGLYYHQVLLEFPSGFSTGLVVLYLLPHPPSSELIIVLLHIGPLTGTITLRHESKKYINKINKKVQENILGLCVANISMSNVVYA